MWVGHAQVSPVYGALPPIFNRQQLLRLHFGVGRTRQVAYSSPPQAARPAFPYVFRTIQVSHVTQLITA
jgi:hypothetical protein